MPGLLQEHTRASEHLLLNEGETKRRWPRCYPRGSVLQPSDGRVVVIPGRRNPEDKMLDLPYFMSCRKASCLFARGSLTDAHGYTPKHACACAHACPHMPMPGKTGEESPPAVSHQLLVIDVVTSVTAVDTGGDRAPHPALPWPWLARLALPVRLCPPCSPSVLAPQSRPVGRRGRSLASPSPLDVTCSP